MYKVKPVRESTAEHYQRRFQRLVEYIFQNLDSPLDLETLSQVACVSPYHLHRLYRCMFGETLADTVKRVRLHYAAQALLDSQDDIEKIGIKAGYSSVQAFSRAFRAAYGMPPAKFRQQGQQVSFSLPSVARDTLEQTLAAPYGVTIENRASTVVVGLSHHGNFMDIGQSFEQLYVQLIGQNIETEQAMMCGLYLHDPFSVPESELRSMAGIILSQEERAALTQPNNLACWQQPAGQYAVLRFKGPYQHLHKAYQWLFGDWLPQSGYLPANTPVMEVYLNNPRQVPASELLTDICLALEVQ